MCGLHGEIRYDNRSPDRDAHQRINAALAPRGPDGQGLHQDGPLLLGHRRLKIIDLSDASAQPFVDDATGYAIAFNGCIYNYRELRRELEGRGHVFRSQGDTEVILRSWNEWGPECVHRFNGMFAFALHERSSRTTWLVRDRLGIKPLYVQPLNGGLRFASTLPALLAGGDVDTSINPTALHHYLSWHAVVPPPHTILNGVQKLPPATIRQIAADGRVDDRRYWDVAFPDSPDRSAAEWEDELHTVMRRAVDRRMVADVPVGVLLSGGVDSSLIVALLAEAGQRDLHTFSVGFDSRGEVEGDEFRYSDRVAQEFGTHHHKIAVPEIDMTAALPHTIAAMSEPMVSHDNVGFYLLSQAVSEHLKVVQSGQGADEIFAGYHWYPPMQEGGNPVDTYAQAFFDQTPDGMAALLRPEARPAQDPSRAFVAAHFAKPGADDPVAKALRLDTQVMLADDPVKRVDNMTMAFGLEARVPFLDHEVVEFAARVPSALKLADGGKGLLKSLARKIVPREVIDRPKGYFPVPALKYLRGPLLEQLRDHLLSPNAHTAAFLDRTAVDQRLSDPDHFITPLRGSECWQLGLLELWLSTHVGGRT
ncbi:MAG: N-acetylglutaminylglutamine amidotransferase [Oceanococcaceae bacterium]